ncbi:polysaccharide lyase family 7 protein [Pseudomonas sp. LS44]|uniref:polysaccharide lyase family 7 protein n=1 Tax=Pseudomonas sp. LS44 TaxID=1357074 RepID=UPI00215A413E|nr:polysaccharide lyase family 7 protein [Pseudomonas sp. LS44]UVE16577.1 polysaccharide lyase family 7 protein [Pseudomonas sp. LS44]
MPYQHSDTFAPPRKTLVKTFLAWWAYHPPQSGNDSCITQLTLPDDAATEVLAAQLRDGYASRYFYLSNTGAMIFVAPITGGTTENSRYPRTELREMLDPADDDRNWSGTGFHELRASCQVIQASSTQQIIVGQIYGFDARPLIKLQWEKGKVKALIKKHPKGSNDDLAQVFAIQVNNDLFSYRIEVLDGVLTVEVDGERFVHDVYKADPAARCAVFLQSRRLRAGG